MSVESASNNYRRKVLYQTDAFEVVSIEWSQTNESTPHNHGWSHCLVLIEDGTFENTVQLGSKTEIHALEVGQVLNTPVGATHHMRCLSSSGRTLHVYTPKIQNFPEVDQFKVESRNTDDFRLSEPTSIVVLEKILAALQQQTISTYSPYFMNQLFSGIWPQMLMAEELIAKSRTTLATIEMSQTFSSIEAEVIEALGQIIGWPSSNRDGVVVPGGSAANFMGIHCARQKCFPEAKQSGIGSNVCKIFVSSEAHYSFKKACAVLGIGTGNLVLVPVDDKGRMDPLQLDRLISAHKATGTIPLMVGATAGTTVLGAFDPLDAIADVCAKHDVWLHVDGAWGAPAMFSSKLRYLVHGIERADSVSVDAHKLFGAQLTCTFFLTKHQGLLLEANDVSGGDYLFHANGPCIDRGKASWQCGRRPDALSFWTIWKSLGTVGLGEFIDNLIAIREETLLWLKGQPRLELVNVSEFLNVCVRILPPKGHRDAAAWSKHVRESLIEKNLAMVNYSTNKEGSFLRLILAHPSLKLEHVTQILRWALAVE